MSLAQKTGEGGESGQSDNSIWALKEKQAWNGEKSQRYHSAHIACEVCCTNVLSGGRAYTTLPPTFHGVEKISRLRNRLLACETRKGKRSHCHCAPKDKQYRAAWKRKNTRTAIPNQKETSRQAHKRNRAFTLRNCSTISLAENGIGSLPSDHAPTR
jgi:hypothetical protein